MRKLSSANFPQNFRKKSSKNVRRIKEESRKLVDIFMNFSTNLTAYLAEIGERAVATGGVRTGEKFDRKVDRLFDRL